MQKLGINGNQSSGTERLVRSLAGTSTYSEKQEVAACSRSNLAAINVVVVVKLAGRFPPDKIEATK